MMKQCKKCTFYNKEYDELREKWNDTENETLHFCCMYESGIPKEITLDTKKCHFFVEKAVT